MYFNTHNICRHLSLRERVVCLILLGPNGLTEHIVSRFNDRSRVTLLRCEGEDQRPVMEKL